MVKCSGCGIEYSLGRKIFHSCDENRIEHGVIWCRDRIERSWNCNPITKSNESDIERTELIAYMKKLIHVVKS
ncbi:MAG: hypothetical protein ACFE96_05570 [Candidatus Hermodarchaeota archaeon]